MISLQAGAPFEGDLGGKKLLSAMPDWVADQIDLADYVGYLQAPTGTWDGVDTQNQLMGRHNFNYRTDYFETKSVAA